MSRPTHPEKKWAAGTNESNADGQSVVAISLVTGGSYRRHAGGLYASHRGPRVERQHCDIGEMLDRLQGALEK